MAWKSWLKAGAAVGGLASAFAAGAMTGRLMLRDELANAQEPARPAPFASEDALVSANAETPATPGLELAGGPARAETGRPDAMQVAAVDPEPAPEDFAPSGKPEATDEPDEQYAAYDEEPEEPDKTIAL